MEKEDPAQCLSSASQQLIHFTNVSVTEKLPLCSNHICVEQMILSSSIWTTLVYITHHVNSFQIGGIPSVGQSRWQIHYFSPSGRMLSQLEECQRYP